MARMPIYEYRCPKGHLFEVFQSMSDDPVETCEICGAAGVQRVFHPVAIHFKGSGFHNTDYGKGRKKAADEATSTNGDKPASSEKSKSKSGSSDSGGSKSDSKTTTASSD